MANWVPCAAAAVAVALKIMAVAVICWGRRVACNSEPPPCPITVGAIVSVRVGKGVKVEVICEVGVFDGNGGRVLVGVALGVEVAVGRTLIEVEVEVAVEVAVLVADGSDVGVAEGKTAATTGVVGVAVGNCTG